MTSPLSAKEKSQIEQILNVAKKIEQNFSEAIESPLFQLKILIQELEFSENPSLTRLAGSGDHLFPQMTLRHFLNFMIPFERILDRSVRDDDFLVTTQDQAQPQLQRQNLIFVLHNLRSSFNVGSLFRLAETLAIQEIHLVGYTPLPTSDGVRKTAMGTESLVRWTHYETIDHSLAVLRESHYRLIALETSKKSLSLYDGSLLPQKFSGTAFVVGNERFGLDFSTLDLCDEVRHIPLVGTKNSLNVASALAVSAFEWHRQNRMAQDAP